MGKHSSTTPQAKRTARTRARVLRLYQAGKPVKVIAARLGIGNQYVLDRLHAGGIGVKADQRARERANRERFAAVWNAATDFGDAAAARSGCRKSPPAAGPSPSGVSSVCG
jgi:hypothetical protein